MEKEVDFSIIVGQGAREKEEFSLYKEVAVNGERGRIRGNGKAVFVVGFLEFFEFGKGIAEDFKVKKGSFYELEFTLIELVVYFVYFVHHVSFLLLFQSNHLQ